MKTPDEMTIVDIINDRKVGVLAPSEILRRQKMNEMKKQNRKNGVGKSAVSEAVSVQTNEVK